MIKYEQIISKEVSLIKALDIMDNTDHKLLIICEDNIFLGLISIGDIQRALLNKKDLSRSVLDCIRHDITVASPEDDYELIKQKMRVERIEAMPIVDKDNVLIDVIAWEDLFDTGTNEICDSLNLPVVIMAGGKGTRLLPLTNIIPKPLIPISDKTIIEEIMQSFNNYGCNKFYISVNYKSKTIEDYFSDRKEWDVEFIHESIPLGTIGSLYKLKDIISDSFFVINCDTLLKIRLDELVDYHKNSNNLVTVVSVAKKMSIPYGTLETEVGGKIISLKEKPEYIYQVNSGMYILEPEVLNYIEDNTFTNITDLIMKLISNNKKVGAFPVAESAWTDIGNWGEYLKIVDRYSLKKDILKDL
jgi:dTDP-glucose pyrophosphorylase